MRIFYHKIFKFYNKMDNMFMLSTSIAFVYFVIRFIQIRQSKDDETPPMKSVIKDTFVVFIASILGVTLLDQLSPFLKENKISGGSVGKSPAFTDNPNF